MTNNNNEKENSKTIKWYEGQVKELEDIRKIYFEMYGYLPDFITQKLQELKDLKIKIKNKKR